MKDTVMKNCQASVIPICEKKAICKNLCRGHYARLARGQQVGITLRKNRSGAIPKHGGSGTRLYNLWKQLKQRCLNPNHPHFKTYEGRLCEEWEEFSTFQTWALSNGYEDNLSINRINNDGPYSPENCEWTTQSVQMRNTRRSKILTIEGEEMTMVEWSEDPRCEVSYYTIRTRLNLGWEQNLKLIRKRGN